MLAVAGLASCALILQNLDSVPPTKDAPFEYVCYQLEEMYDVPCGALEAPTIIYSNIINPGYHGVYYHGEPYIFINPNSPEELKEEIILHEMGHYIIYELDLPPKGDKCEGERVVREISGGTWGEDDRFPYGCPAP